MIMLWSRVLLRGPAAAPLVAIAARNGLPAAFAAPARTAPASAAAELKSMTAGAKPISADERRARIAKVQSLMGERKIAALLVEPGSSLDYFTGIMWRRSERI